MRIVYSADTCFGLYCKMTETVGVDFTCAAQIATNPIKIDDKISPI